MKIVLVQGINGNVGTSSVSAALAHSCTLIDKKSLVVDANLKKAEPQLATFFNLEKDSFGWSDALLQQTFDKNAPSFVYHYENQCYLMPLGKAQDLDLSKSNAIADKLIFKLKQLQKLDYIFIDGGIRGNELGCSLTDKVDLVLSLLKPDGNSAFRLNYMDPLLEHEFLLINDFNLKSKLNYDLKDLYQVSPFKAQLLKSTITYDECMLQSLIRQMPITKYLPISASSLDIQKLLFELILILDGEKAQSDNGND